MEETTPFQLLDKVLDYFIEKDVRAEIRTQERNKAILDGLRQVAGDIIEELVPIIASQKSTSTDTHALGISPDTIKGIINLMNMPDEDTPIGRKDRK